MTKLFRVGLVALLGFAVATPAALASKVAATPEKGQMTVKDDAHVFDKDSVIKAESKFHGVTFKSPTHFTVQTFEKVPADKKADFEKVKNDGSAKHAFMKEWVRELAPVESERGVFVLICQEARALEVVTDKQTDLKRHFGDDNANALAKIFTAAMVEANKGTKTADEKRAVLGESLVKGTDYVIGQLRNTSAPEATGTTRADGGSETKGAGMHWIWWVAIVAGVLLVIWIIIALIRAMTGNVYGGGYGGGGYGGYGGGGGPGFFGMFMGGMLGSMAGMWMYNSMMGTHYSHDPGAATGDTGAADGGADNADTGAGDYDNGAEAGGDWGDDAGGGAGDADAGGGGGDWGNDGGGGGDWGGDAGGGGDFGGGGGDW